MKKAESEKKKKEQKCCEVRNRDTDGLVMEPSHYCRRLFLRFPLPPRRPRLPPDVSLAAGAFGGGEKKKATASVT